MCKRAQSKMHRRFNNNPEYIFFPETNNMITVCYRPKFNLNYCKTNTNDISIYLM